LAFLVCYSRSALDDHNDRKAIYLDQKFYELIFKHCVPERSRYASLSVIASLRYKSPLLVVAGEQLDSLDDELAELQRADLSHPQLAEFRHVCATAKADSCSLSISGDMYPEL
jgi:hypothetical protein